MCYDNFRDKHYSMAIDFAESKGDVEWFLNRPSLKKSKTDEANKV